MAKRTLITGITGQDRSYLAAAGEMKQLRLGNLETKRDWGHAWEYVEAMWLMQQAASLDDYVIPTGKTHSVWEFCGVAFAEAGVAYRDYVVTDENFYRPAEVDLLICDAAKARKALGWEPETTFRELVIEMVHEDLRCQPAVTNANDQISERGNSYVR
jgi:GDPmannose 4,6-dehydratase